VVPNNALSRQSRRQKANRGLAGWPLRPTAGVSGSVHHLTELRTSAPGVSRLKEFGWSWLLLGPRPASPPALVGKRTVRALSIGRPIAGANGNLNPDATLAARNQQIGGDSLGSRSFVLVDRHTYPDHPSYVLFGGFH
jgi:hypothetical protein